MKKTYLTTGPVFKSLLRFSIPLIITNVVQLLFHAADVAVLAFFTDDLAVAAVGACGSIITLLVSLFTGFSTGSNVLVAKRVGAQNEDGIQRAVGTSLTMGLLSGVILMAVAIPSAEKLLVMMNCQPEALEMATTYMRLYFVGMPVMMLYNFVSAIMRASGDSVRPMAYMLLAGVCNIGLNVFFIAALSLTVEGVALATILSKVLALTSALIHLIRSKGVCRIIRKHLRIRKTELMEIVRVGIPTCMCSIFFYFANVIISSTVNRMGTDTMTANAVSGQFDGVIYTVGSAIAIATSAMVGQNYGAKLYDRIRRIIKTSIIYVTTVSLALGVVFVLLAEQLLGLLTDSPAVIAIAKDRVTLLCLTYFVTSIMEVLAFSLRALGRQKSTMVVGAICGLGVRSFWAWVIWPMHPTIAMLFSCYWISAFVAIIIYSGVYRSTMRNYDLASQYGT